MQTWFGPGRRAVVLLALAVTHFVHIKAYWQMYHTTAKRPTPIDAVIVAEAIGK